MCLPFVALQQYSPSAGWWQSDPGARQWQWICSKWCHWFFWWKM